MNFTEASLLTPEEILKKFNSSSQGLTDQEIKKRQKIYGFNEMQKPPRPWPRILLRQLNNPFMYLLYCASLISFSVGDIIEGSMIVFFICFNTILGFYQEYSAEQIVQFLAKHLSPTAKVKRNNVITTIESRLLVPGDIVLIESGDLVPADLRLIESQNLSVDESLLTGESMPAQKKPDTLKKESSIADATDVCFSGTLAVGGNGIGIIFATGEQTEVGTINLATSSTAKYSNFTKTMKEFSAFIVKFILIALALLLVLNIILKWPNVSIITLFSFTLALAVTITPELLPLVITFSLSRGARQLANNKVIVKRLSAIEDLGNIEILCSDKTGTLTENKMRVIDINADNPNQTLLYAYIGSAAMNNKGTPQNPFDNALWNSLNSTDKETTKVVSKIYEIPFDSFRMRTTTVVEMDKQKILIVKGAFEALKKLCSPQSVKENVNQWIIDQGMQGRRTLAIAYKKLPETIKDFHTIEEKDLNFLGVISFEDPIKSDSQQAIQKAAKLGIKIKILTGDAPEVSFAVGEKIGLLHTKDEVITGAQFDQLSPEQQKEAVEHYVIFARVSPLQKCTIIQLLQQKNVVGYLGDGINDAPALKTAAVGIAVKGSSDVANQAADIILLQKSLSIIINGIFEGRTVFENTLKYIKISLSSNFGNFFSIGIASLFINFLPMLPRQILFVNILTDLPMLALSTDSVSLADLKKMGKPTIRSIAFSCILFGLVSIFFDFIIFILFYRIPALLQTNWFIEGILSEVILIFSLRTRLPFYKAARPSFLLIAMSILVVSITFLLVYIKPLRAFFEFIYPTQIPLLMLIVCSYFITTELVKYFYYKKRGNRTIKSSRKK